MSRITDPINQPWVTCGFFDSRDGDRKYNATQMSSIFDGMITDGILKTVGNQLNVRAGTDNGNTVVVQPGRAWFHQTWTLVEQDTAITCDSAGSVDRWDAIVIEINKTKDVRDNSIKYVKGTTIEDMIEAFEEDYENDIYRIPLCFIQRKANSIGIKESDLRNAVAYKYTPIATTAVESYNTDSLRIHWEDVLMNFMDEMTREYENWYETMQSNADVDKKSFDNWMSARKSEIMKWFNDLKGALQSEDVATDLYVKLSDLSDELDAMSAKLDTTSTNLTTKITNEQIERILVNGLTAGTKTISDDGKIIITIQYTPNGYMSLSKRYNDNFTVCTIELYETLESDDGTGNVFHGTKLGELVKTFSSDGMTITSELTIM